jgi:tripartite-type tricarboxylate transporter receptor subunit TctC
MPYIKDGRLRVLGVTSTARWPALSDTPTLAEFMPGFEASTWVGLATPRQTPPDVIAKLASEADAALADNAMVARIADLGGVPFLISPADFDKFIVEQTATWGRVIRAAKIKLE